jgi:hypothetical protein
VKNEVDIGVGILRDCDLVCKMEISGILKESVRQKDSRHGTHRVKSKNLSVREYFDEAQHDLNVYAREKGWKRV